MRRLLALLLLALSLTFASGPAFAVPKSDCPMASGDQMQGDHENMDCCAATCAPECAAVCPGAVMPFPESTATPSIPSARVGAWIAERLPSVDLTGADPPPRTTFS
jgi:hypothetical protein